MEHFSSKNFAMVSEIPLQATCGELNTFRPLVPSPYKWLRGLIDVYPPNVLLFTIPLRIHILFPTTFS